MHFFIDICIYFKFFNADETDPLILLNFEEIVILSSYFKCLSAKLKMLIFMLKFLVLLKCIAFCHTHLYHNTQFCLKSSCLHVHKLLFE